MPRSRKVKCKGLNLRSGYEKKVAEYLAERKVRFAYEEDKVAYVVPSTKRNYIPDFRLPNGIYLEAKGKFDAASRRKMLLVVEQNPDLDIRMLFMRDNPIRKGSKTKYSDWAEKHGIKYAVSLDGRVPAEWINEE